MSGAFVIFCGFMFARIFLQTKQHTPFFDKLFLMSIANALVLFFAALMQWKTVAIVSITFALLMYPLIIIAGTVRWRQGSLESGIFTIAWLSLVIGLVVQACRDLGFVEHNFFNYYWPPVASFVELLAIMVALGVQVARLRRQKKQAEHEAQTDPLTGIANRRSFYQLFEERLEQARRKDIPISLMIFDLDYFKQINDQYGHHVGDQALIMFCKIVSSELRTHDVFGRLGGEEFGLVVNEDLEGAKASAERLCNIVATSVINANDELLELSVSIGVAESAESETTDDLVARADEALYSAKANGRNQVSVSLA